MQQLRETPCKAKTKKLGDIRSKICWIAQTTDHQHVTTWLLLFVHVNAICEYFNLYRTLVFLFFPLAAGLQSRFGGIWIATTDLWRIPGSHTNLLISLTDQAYVKIRTFSPIYLPPPHLSTLPGLSCPPWRLCCPGPSPSQLSTHSVAGRPLSLRRLGWS